MPGKRANAGSKAAASPKKQRVAAPEDPLLKAYAPVLEVLKSGTADDGASVEMLCAALPFALSAPAAGERHAYQERLLNTVAARLSGTVSSRQEGVAALETEAASLEADRGQSAAVHEEIAKRLEETTTAKEAAAEASTKQEAAVKEAQEALASAQESAAAADSERLSMEKYRDDFVAGLTSVWEPLKTSELSGAKWRLRDKKLEELSELLRQSGAGASLLAALPVALKIKAGTRPEFAEATVAYAEEVYAKHIEVLKERVESFGAEITARAAKVTEAESGLEAARAALDAAQEADIAAQNAWVAVTGEEREQQAKLNDFGPAAAALEQRLLQVRDELAHLKGVFDSFEALRPVDAVLKKLSGDVEVSTEAATQLEVAEEPVHAN